MGRCAVKRRRRALGRPSSVVGLDLSLASTGMVAIPIGWNFDMARVVVGTCGYALKADASLEEHYDRYLQIAHDVSVFCINNRARHVWVEDHAYMAGGAGSARTKEMTGRVKTELYDEHNLVARPVQPASARAVLLGRVPKQGKGKTKAYVIRNVKRLPMTADWIEDVCDAFVCANYGIMKVGGVAMTFPGE